MSFSALITSVLLIVRLYFCEAFVSSFSACASVVLVSAYSVI